MKLDFYLSVNVKNNWNINTQDNDLDSWLKTNEFIRLDLSKEFDICSELMMMRWVLDNRYQKLFVKNEKTIFYRIFKGDKSISDFFGTITNNSVVLIAIWE